MFPHYQEKHFAAIELVHNIKKGYWLNVMIMRDTFPIFREARTFGGKRLIRDLTCSILGFMKAEMSQNNFDYIKTNLTQIFKTFDQKKKNSKMIGSPAFMCWYALPILMLTFL